MTRPIRALAGLTILLAAAVAGCSLHAGNDGYSKLELKIDRSALATRAQERAARNSSGPSSIDGFTCLAVNVVGPGVPTVWGYFAPDLTAAYAGSACTYPGVSSALLSTSAASGTLSVKVPTGPRRLVQVLGVTSKIGCPTDESFTQKLQESYSLSQPNSPNPYFTAVDEVGRTVVDVFRDIAVTVNDTYDSSNVNDFFNCGVPAGLPSGTPSSTPLSYSQTVLATPGLAGYWALDDANASIGMPATDSSGSFGNGTYSGSNLALQPAAIQSANPGNSVSFNSGYVTITGSHGFPASAVTFEGWVKASTCPPSPPDHSIAGASGTNAKIALEMAYGGATCLARFYVQDDVANSAFSEDSGTYNVADGAWHYLAGTYDGTTVSTYVDGNLVGTSIPSPSVSAGFSVTSAYIGYDVITTASFTGQIDDVAMYDRVLGASEILAHYQAAGYPAGAP